MRKTTYKEQAKRCVEAIEFAFVQAYAKERGIDPVLVKLSDNQARDYMFAAFVHCWGHQYTAACVVRGQAIVDEQRQTDLDILYKEKGLA